MVFRVQLLKSLCLYIVQYIINAQFCHPNEFDSKWYIATITSFCSSPHRGGGIRLFKTEGPPDPPAPPAIVAPAERDCCCCCCPSVVG